MRKSERERGEREAGWERDSDELKKIKEKNILEEIEEISSVTYTQKISDKIWRRREMPKGEASQLSSCWI